MRACSAALALSVLEHSRRGPLDAGDRRGHHRCLRGLRDVRTLDRALRLRAVPGRQRERFAKLGQPDNQHWFGTTDLQTDVLSRVIWGARTALRSCLSPWWRPC